MVLEYSRIHAKGKLAFGADRGMAFQIPSSRSQRKRRGGGNGLRCWTRGSARELSALMAGFLIIFGTVAVYGTETADEICQGLPTRGCALAAALIASPDAVLVGQKIDVTMTVTNTTEAKVNAVTPSIISVHGSGHATLLTGPAPPLATIPAKASQRFTFTFLVTEAGTISFRGSAEGVQRGRSTRVRSRQTASNTLPAQLPSLEITSAVNPENPIPGQPLTMTLTIANRGKTTITGVSPSLVLRNDPSLATLMNGPISRTVALPGGASSAFVFTYRVNQAGRLEFTARASGTDAETGKAVAAPEVDRTVMALTPQGLTATLTAGSSSVDLHQTITLTMTVENAGERSLDAVVPSLVTPSSPSSVKLSSGPTPVSAKLAPGGTQTFTFAYRVTKPGTLTFTAHAVGTDSISKATVKSPKATSNPVTIAATSTSLASSNDSSATSEDPQTARSPDGSEDKAKSPDADTNTPPFGYLLAPRPDAKVGGTVAVVGGAFDKEDSTLPVTILLDGVPIGSLIVTTGAAPNTGSQESAAADYSTFSFDWDTAATTVGPHTLAMQATDSEGKSTLFGTRTVTVVGPNNPPVGFLDLPFPNATIGGTIDVAGWAVDKEDPVVALTILLDGAPLAIPAPTERAELEAVFQNIPWAKYGGFTYQWDTATTPAGQHTFAILATDPQGESSIFGTRTVTVTGSPNSPPFGYFDLPPAVTRLGVTLPLIGTASDREDASVIVALLLDGIPIGTPVEVPTGGNFQFSLDTATATAGPHTLAVQATDSEGASAIIGIRRITLIQ